MDRRSVRRGWILPLLAAAAMASGGASTTLASDPSRMSATAGTLSVRLAWENSSTGAAWGYNVYRFAGGVTGVPERVNLLPLPGGRGGALTDGGLVPGELYAYRVTAIDGRGAESWLPGYALARAVALPGDVDGLPNEDGLLRVDGLDLLRVQLAFGRSAGDPGFDASCDLDCDGTVDGEDLEAVARNYGRTAPSGPPR